MENWVGPGNEASSSQSSFIPRLAFCIPASFLFNICTYVVSISLAYLCIITRLHIVAPSVNFLLQHDVCQSLLKRCVVREWDYMYHFIQTRKWHSKGSAGYCVAVKSKCGLCTEISFLIKPNWLVEPFSSYSHWTRKKNGHSLLCLTVFHDILEKACELCW